MLHKVEGVIARTRGQRVEKVNILVPDPGPGEVLVRIKACGVCHTDLHYREGAINDEFPFLLGHEASGYVEDVGPGVANVRVGDFVIIAWRSPCGTCRSCLKGKPWYCFDSKNAIQTMKLEDGTPVSAALGIGAFTELTLVDSGQAIKVNPSVNPNTASLLGCGVMAGLGAAVNTGSVSMGDSVAVFGCGGVGNAAIVGSRLAGAQKIIAVDIDDRKLKWALDFGATHTVNSLNTDPVKFIRSVTSGNGADVTIEAVGKSETYEQAFYSRDHAGVLVLVGVPEPSMKIELPLIEVFGRGGSLKSSWYGDCLPSRDFPRYIDLHLEGRINLDNFVTETIPLSDVENSFERMESGEVLRSVVVFE
ncbi:MAG: S-(hydroxymethyl)mycothiol dehydrogenase [SAR202 cluster bacterium]|jgi:S-(hydroxymethyl)mycothiol dehydrogenase|nr:S-(hydroxymethyl)mycothiol dehydrogenase [SAR202 cluster bacterium]|tara:strand:- start:2463 stop:3551 length:1089 start_codon:yes stop_codon:yes gene_type:complete